jgi:hypothetical protein
MVIYVPSILIEMTDSVMDSDAQGAAFQNLNAGLDAFEGRLLDQLRQSYSRLSGDLTSLNKDLTALVKNQEKQIYEDASKKQATRLQLFNTWRLEHEASIKHIADTIERQEEQRKRQKYQRKVLNSLYFEKIEDRRNMIERKHTKTLQWVFDPPTNSQWSRISDWLRDSALPVYWITGKAGSGKSTLMKWLLLEKQTRTLLEEWAGSREMLVASYYFWLAAKTPEQKSLSGLLRSLLYDLLQTHTELIPQVSPNRWRAFDLDLVHFPAWTEEDLIAAIRVFIKSTHSTSCICLFIDGLDEFDGKYHQRVEVIDLLKDLSVLAGVKICVSSRDWAEFEQAFGAGPKLRLEDLTKNDIEDYINTELAHNGTFQALRDKDSKLCSRLVSEIIDKARGVWLWVVLVVRSLLQGLGYEDSAQDLLNRLRAVPEELEPYFLQIISKIDRFYLPKALKLFKLVLEAPHDVSVMSASFIEEGEDVSSYTKPRKQLTKMDMQSRIQLARLHVNVRCMGLLESTPDEFAHGGYSLDFLHRTARDFLGQAKIQQLIGMESVAAFDVNLFSCEAAAAQIQMLDSSDPDRVDHLDLILSEAIFSAQRLECEAGVCLSLILKHMDHAIEQMAPIDHTYQVAEKNMAPVWLRDTGQPSPLLPMCLQFSLSTYAKEVILANSNILRVGYHRPLLDLALRRMDHGLISDNEYMYLKGDAPDPEVVEMILKRGADPNEKFGSSTIWKRFLRRIDERAVAFSRLSPTGRKEWIDVCELCIRYGAARVLESHTHVPNRPSSRTRVTLGYTEKLAKDTFEAAFGMKEAARLDALASRLQMTGVNMLTWGMRKMGVGFGG